MADSIADFARRVRDALMGDGEEDRPVHVKREARKPETTSPRVLETALTNPEYGHMYSDDGKDIGVARSLDYGPRTAPNKLSGEEMSGDRTLHNPTKVREKAPGEYYRAEKPEDQELRTKEHMKKAGILGSKVKRDLSAPNDSEGVAPQGQEHDDENGFMAARERVMNAPAKYVNDHGYKVSPETSDAIMNKINESRAAADSFAMKRLQGTFDEVGHLPGASAGAGAGLKFAAGAKSLIGKAAEASGLLPPKVRDVSSITREFSNEEDKKRYIEEKQKAGK